MKFKLFKGKSKARPIKDMDKSKKKRAVMYNILIVFFAAVAFVCAFQIISYYVQEGTNEKLNEEIIEEVVITPNGSDENTSQGSTNGGYRFATIPESIDFDKLLAKNDDVVGWIFNQNGIINYPVLKGDDNDYYLNRNVNKTKNVNGSIFMNCKNNGKFTDKHTLIYGHSMDNGTMFASLLKYRNQSYYDAYPSFYLYTPYGKYKLDVFSAFETKDGDRVYTMGYNSSDYSDFISYAFSKSLIKADVSVANGDRLVTLSTCAYSSKKARFVVIAKVVPIEENLPAEEVKEPALLN